MKTGNKIGGLIAEISRFWLNLGLIVVALVVSVVTALSLQLIDYGRIHWPSFYDEVAILFIISILLLAPVRWVIRMLARSQQQLKESQNELNEIMEHSIGMLFIVSADGKILDVNSNALFDLGYDKNNIVGRPFNDVDQKQYLKHNPAEINRLKQGSSLTFESNFCRANGEIFPTEVRAYWVTWKQLECLLLVATDISSRKNFEQRLIVSHQSVKQVKNELELRVQERTKALAQEIKVRIQAEKSVNLLLRYMQILIDSIPTVIFTLNHKYEIEHWNQAARDLINRNHEQIKDNPLEQVLPHFYPQIFALIQQHQQDQYTRVRIKDLHHTLTYEVRVSRMRTDENPGWVVRVDDVSKRVQLEDLVVQSEKMLSLGGLAAGMAHEINNPLGAILQSIQNIQRRFDKELPRNNTIADKHNLSLDALDEYLTEQRIHRFLQGIQQAGQRAANIVSDMLSFARPTKSATEPVVLKDTINSAIRLAASDYAHKRNFDFSCIQLDCPEPLAQVRVLAQKNQLEQVFLNLLSNAIQALMQMELDRKPAINIAMKQKQNSILIFVEDNGPGMPEETRKRVFEPFFTTKPEGVGTGLGLSVSFFIISDQLNGSLEVDSIEGEGTIFTIVLPIFKTDIENDEQYELPI